MKTVNTHLRGIIFDMDGTIIDTEMVWETALMETLKSYGVNKSPAEYESLLGHTVGRHLNDASEIILELFELNVPRDEFIRNVVRNGKAMLVHDIDFIRGFENFHRRLTEAKITASIATNCDIENLQALVEKMRFADFFGDQIFCIDHVENKAKPDPALFLHAAEKLNAAPEECIVFEDSLAGFTAANAANISCIGIKNKKNATFIDEHTHRHIEHYDDADEAVRKIITEVWQR